MTEPIFYPDLAAVLDHYNIQLPYSYSGDGWVKILCVVHDERNPSATVNLDLGKIHCHACGFHGDALDIVKARENCGTREASEYSRNHFPAASGTHVRGKPDRLSRRGVSEKPGHRRGDGEGAPSRLRRSNRTRWD